MSKRNQELDDNQSAVSSGSKRRKLEHKDSQGPISSVSKRKLKHEDYTVGWICPLEVEQVAALEMLDEEHERLPQSRADHNVYTLGSIGGYNVVIAGLHQPGNNPAATVVTQMRMTFPELKFGLLVGIGGGVPTKTDNGMIRLGDVVVSKPAGEHSGAVQYNHGKAETGRFRRTGALTPPPAVLLNAAQDLAAQQARTRKDPIAENIKRIDTGIPGLRKYKHPGWKQDHLYRPDYIHVDPGVSCDECGCDPAWRAQRAIDYDDGSGCPRVVIHRGTIASGELVIKNGILRDQLAKECGVLCFETEAAGALADFPCIVIRGISDYCDSHKNDQWHGYAAAAAAAYARQLFFHMPIDKVKRYMSLAMEDGIDRLSRRQDDQDRQAIADWLTPVDYAPQQSDFISRRQEGTGQWLLNSNKFQEWTNQNKQTLFCPGIPGAGKTIIASIVIDHLWRRFQNDASVGIAYLYCNFRRLYEQKPDDLLASLLKQFIQQQPSMPQSVKNLYKSYKDGRTRPLFDNIVKVLHSVIADYSKTFIIIDALDECQVSVGGRRRFLLEILYLQAKTGANLFITSRFIPEIGKEFKGSIFLEIRASDEDVQRYMDSYMLQLPSFVLRNLDLQREIKSKILKAADGMFLLAQLHLHSLTGKRSPKTVRTALRKLPKGSDALDNAYKEAMERIEGQILDSRELAKQVLSWISCAKRPLTTLELQHALAVEMVDLELDEENLPEIEDMISVCAGLVTVDEESGIIRLVHHTTQEYFKRARISWFPAAQRDITMTCIAYLSFNAFNTGFCLTDEEFEARLRVNILYNYATRNWGYHARTASTDVEQLILDFLKNEAKVAASSQAMFACGSSPGYSQRVAKQMTGLHLAAHFGLREIIMALFREGHDPNVKDTYGRTPLSWAARNGQEAVVRLLLEERPCIDPGSKDMDDRTPLHEAAENGHRAVVGLLLDYGAGVSVRMKSNDDDDFCSGAMALHLAALNGHEAVVQLLLEKGADLDAETDLERTALHSAVCHDCEAVVRLLLKKGANVEAKDAYGQTALHMATEIGNEAIVQLLLEKGADISAKENTGRVALHEAADGGHEAVVRLLLLEGGDVAARDDNGGTALHWAATKAHEAAARMLLENGADIEAEDDYGWTALHLATKYGGEIRQLMKNEREIMVRLLVENGANIAAQTHDWTSVLHVAAEGGNETVMQLLMEKEADVAANDAYGRTALHLAAESGHEAVVQLLIKKGANVVASDIYGRTALHLAAEGGHEAVARLLVENGADVAEKDDNGEMVLQKAVKRGTTAWYGYSCVRGVTFRSAG